MNPDAFGALVIVGAIVTMLAALASRGARPAPPVRPQPPDRPPPAPGRRAPRTVAGRAWVVDGDTIVVAKERLRLFGIDAPEMEHPYGHKAKWEMVALCKGRRIRAEIVATDRHGRQVAQCYLPDGSDLSAELVKAGLAIDWPKYSGGAYAPMEVPGVRRKLWRAHNRQTIGRFEH